MSPYQPPELLAAHHQLAGFHCRTFEQLQREQERGYMSSWARHIWAARQRGT